MEGSRDETGSGQVQRPRPGPSRLPIRRASSGSVSLGFLRRRGFGKLHGFEPAFRILSRKLHAQDLKQAVEEAQSLLNDESCVMETIHDCKQVKFTHATISFWQRAELAVQYADGLYSINNRRLHCFTQSCVFLACFGNDAFSRFTFICVPICLHLDLTVERCAARR